MSSTDSNDGYLDAPISLKRKRLSMAVGVDPKKMKLESHNPITYFKFRPIDCMDFFRCLVILLCYHERYVIIQNGTPKYYSKNLEFSHSFYTFVESQYWPLSKRDLFEILIDAKQLLKSHGKIDAKEIISTRKMYDLTNDALKTEIDKAVKLLKKYGNHFDKFPFQICFRYPISLQKL